MCSSDKRSWCHILISAYYPIPRLHGLTYTARENENSVFTVCHKRIDYGPTYWPRSASNSDDTHYEVD